MIIKDEKKTEVVREAGNKYNITWELYLNGDTKKLEKIGKSFDGGDWIFNVGEYLTEDTARRMLEWQNTTKESVINAGRKAQDKKAWFLTLNPTEKFLAKKYVNEVNSEQPKTTNETTTLTEKDL